MAVGISKIQVQKFIKKLFKKNKNMQQKQLINWLMILLFNGICFTPKRRQLLKEFCKLVFSNQPGKIVNGEFRKRKE